MKGSRETRFSFPAEARAGSGERGREVVGRRRVVRRVVARERAWGVREVGWEREGNE